MNIKSRSFNFLQDVFFKSRWAGLSADIKLKPEESQSFISDTTIFRKEQSLFYKYSTADNPNPIQSQHSLASNSYQHQEGKHKQESINQLAYIFGPNRLGTTFALENSLNLKVISDSSHNSHPPITKKRTTYSTNIFDSSLKDGATGLNNREFISIVPNDPSFTNNDLWGLSNTYAGSNAEAAWSQNIIGSTNVVLGVIDTGIDYTHPDLYRNIWINPGEVPIGVIDTDKDGTITFNDLNNPLNALFAEDKDPEGTIGHGYIDAGDLLQHPAWIDGQDTDGNGYLDDIIGWDFANNDNNPFDDNSHGSHVAGTIGAMGNNGEGVTGINWNIQLVPLKFLDDLGRGFTSDAELALNYFTEASAKYDSLQNPNGVNRYVGTNNSYGGGGKLDSFGLAIETSANLGNIFISAAGNNSSNNDHNATYPGNYEAVVNGIDHNISVASTDQTGLLSSFSNFGPTISVDIAAPGSNIRSTVPGGGYDFYSGTSMAAPHVAGSLALLASVNPHATGSELLAALYAGADRDNSLLSSAIDGKRLNIIGAINALKSASKVPSLEISLAEGGIPQTSENGDFISISLMLTSAPIDDVNIQIESSNTLEGRPSENSLTFTPINWNTPQFITIFGQDDSQEDGNSPYNIIFTSNSSDVEYDQLTSSLELINLDNDIPLKPTEILFEDFEGTNTDALWSQDSQLDWAITSQRSAGTGLFSAEVDGRASNAWFGLTQAIDIQNYGDVEISFDWMIETTFDNNEYLAFDILTADGSTWSEVKRLQGNIDEHAGNPFQSESFTLKTLQENLGLSGSSLNIRFRASSNRSNEDAFVDNIRLLGLPSKPPTAGIEIATSGPSETFENGASSSFKIVLTKAPSSDVTIPIRSSNSTEGKISTSSIIFTPNNWDTPQSVSVLGQDDAVDDDDQSYQVEFLSSRSSDISYNGLIVESINYINIDDDTAAINITPSSELNTSEGGEKIAHFDVKLNSQPTGNVVINISSSDNSEGNPSSSTITFTPGNWNSAQTVTVTGADDTDLDGNQAYTIFFNSNSSDEKYHILPQQSFILINEDNEVQSPAPAPTQQDLFWDNFEGASAGSYWIQDSQNDWRITSQRSANGGQFSAEVDGLASGASISMRQGIDISNYEDTIINFDWLIERNYDTSDYLAFEVSTDNGSSWAEIKRLRGNIDEARGNPFRNETFRVNNLINDFNLESTGFLNLRFTGTANRGNEDAFFDNVAITGINNIVPVI